MGISILASGQVRMQGHLPSLEGGSTAAPSPVLRVLYTGMCSPKSQAMVAS